VAVDENIGNQANNNDNDNVMMGQIDADADEYIDPQTLSELQSAARDDPGIRERGHTDNLQQDRSQVNENWSQNNVR